MPQSSSSTTKTQAQSASKPAPALKYRALIPRLAGLAAVGGVAWWLLFSGPPTDRALTQAEEIARTAAYMQAGALVLKPVTPEERARALQSMELSAVQQQALERQRTELVWLSIWDDAVEDGDMVAVESDGFRKTVVLTNAPQQLAIPKPRGGVVTLTGVRDGGGGITVAAATGGGQVGLPRMAPGQTISIPVR